MLSHTFWRLRVADCRGLSRKNSASTDCTRAENSQRNGYWRSNELAGVGWRRMVSDIKARGPSITEKGHSLMPERRIASETHTNTTSYCDAQIFGHIWDWGKRSPQEYRSGRHRRGGQPIRSPGRCTRLEGGGLSRRAWGTTTTCPKYKSP